MKLSIKAKIMSGFVIIFIISMIIGVYGLFSIQRISAMSAKQSEIQAASAALSDVLEAHFTWRQNLTIAVFSGSEFTGSYDPNNCALGKWRNSDEAKTTTNSNISALLEKLDSPHYYIHTQAESIMGLVAENRTQDAEKILIEEILPKANEAIGLLGEIANEYDVMTKNQMGYIENFQSQSAMIITGMIVFVTLLSIILSLYIVKSILKPLRTLAQSANLVATGNFNVKFRHDVNDEIGKLTQSFSMLVDTFKTLIFDMNKMSQNHSNGDIDYLIESSKYKGEFQDVASGINMMIREYVDNTIEILNITQKYAEGDFSAKLKILPGKKAAANRVLDTVSENLMNVEKSVLTLVDSAMRGELDRRIDNSLFKGDWKDIITGINNLLEAVDAPLIEAQEALLLVSNGKLDVKIKGKYSGQFDKMATSINKTIEILSTYISEISTVLNKMASDNFNVEISRDYIGSFSSIKIALNAIINRLNSVISEIGVAAEQVSIGAEQVSTASVNLSQGTTEQAGSVEELNATIDDIFAKTTKNAENSTNAYNLIATAKKDAQQGNTEMSKMLSSMAEINDASLDISKIIKVIEDIAFQTNLLALNAAVEAARAGEHGKGFSVVAEEVRNLAAKSQDSAKETNQLIEHSMSRVKEGSKIANETAAALTKIAEGVENVSGIISKIEMDSKEQANAIAQVNEAISHISQVTQGNSATSEQSAAAAEQLSSQAEMLKSMITRFELVK